MRSALSLLLASCVLAMPCRSWAAEPPPPAQAALPASQPDTVDRYIADLQLESRLFLAGGAGAIGATLAISLIDLGVSEDGARATPYIVATGMPIGLAALVAGVPSMLLAPRYKQWYLDNGPAPNHLAKLKLLRRWRLEGLRTRRDAGLIGGGVLGVSAALGAVVWAVRDTRGENGGGAFAYNGADAYTTLTLSLAAAGSLVTGLLFAKELDDETRAPHRLFGPEPVSVGPAVSFAPAPDGRARVDASFVASFRF